MDVLLAFPGILLAIALVAVLGPSLTQRRARADGDRLGGLRAARARAGAEAARARVRAGGPRARRADARVVIRHVMPGTLPAVTVQATLGMAGAIIAEASLSFLGLGVQPPTPSWGTMLDAGRAHLLDAPHLTIFPGAGDCAARARLQLPRRRLARAAGPGALTRRAGRQRTSRFTRTTSASLALMAAACVSMRRAASCSPVRQSASASRARVPALR